MLNDCMFIELKEKTLQFDLPLYFLIKCKDNNNKQQVINHWLQENITKYQKIW